METKERTYFLLILLATAAVLSFLVFQPFIPTVILAVICAVLLQPLKHSVEKYVTPSPAFSALITLLLGVLIIFIPLSLVGTLVIQETEGAYASLATGNTGLAIEEVTESVGVWLEPRFPGAHNLATSVSSELEGYLADGLQWFVRHAGAAFSSAIAVMLRTLIFLMALYYLLCDGSRLYTVLTRKSPLEDREMEDIFSHLSKTITGIIRGSLMIACIQGILSGIGFAIFGLPNATLWGVTTAFAALIPGVGTSLVFIPAIIFLIVSGHIGAGLGLLLWAVLLVGLIDNFLAPKLMSRGAGLHPLLILLSIIGGLSFYGPAGIFMGPLTVSLLFALYLTYSNAKLTTK